MSPQKKQHIDHQEQRSIKADLIKMIGTSDVAVQKVRTTDGSEEYRLISGNKEQSIIYRRAKLRYPISIGLKERN